VYRFVCPWLLGSQLPSSDVCGVLDACSQLLLTCWTDGCKSLLHLCTTMTIFLPSSTSCMQGSLQLAADLEYVCNSIMALGADLPAALATACTLSTGVLESDFKGMLATGVADGSLDQHACKVMARMRGIDLA
jgi:hypothetical protein